MTTKETRDKLAAEQGKRHAHPEIRSMYPSESRGVMAHQFAQLYSLGFDAGHTHGKLSMHTIAKDWQEQADRLAEALEFYLNHPDVVQLSKLKTIKNGDTVKVTVEGRATIYPISKVAKRALAEYAAWKEKENE